MTKILGTYSGSTFPGLNGPPPLVINAAVCYTRFKTDGSGCYRDNNSYWGYRFTCQGQHLMAVTPPAAPMSHVTRLNSSVDADTQLVEYAQTMLIGRMSIDYPVEQKWAVSRHRYNGPCRSLDKIVDMSGWNEFKSEAYKIALQVLQPRETLDLPPHHIMIIGNKGSGKTSASKLMADLLIETGIRYGKIYFIDGYDAADDPDKFLKDIQDDSVSVVVIDDVEDFDKTKQSGGVGGKIGDLRRFMDLNKFTKTLIITGSDPKLVDNNFLSVHPSFRSLFSHSITLPNFTGIQIRDLFMKEMQKHQLVAEPTEPGGVSLTTVCVALLAEYARTDRLSFSNAHAVIQFFDRGFKNARMRMEYSGLSGRDLYVLKKQDFVAAPVDPSTSPTFVKLMKMVGLEAVKEALIDIVNGAKNDYNNRIRGLPCTPKAFHRAFVGKPGILIFFCTNINSRLNSKFLFAFSASNRNWKDNNCAIVWSNFVRNEYSKLF
jgi:energy-coupling factor transporter ATP-binding protein EcfA2